MDQRRKPVMAGQKRRALFKRSKTLNRRKRLGTELLEPRHLLAGDVIISEIMYHAVSGDPGEDWIELFNRGVEAVNLNGYQLTAGIDFTFPEVMLEAGGYLAVAADVDKFSALYPSVSNVVGGWDGKLSNNGENIRLVDILGLEVDETFYADSGDFAFRRLVPVPTDLVNFVGACIGRPTLDGWEWIAPHDGEGATLELINADFTNDLAHNWTASAADGGTPGAANSVAAVDIAPAVSEVAHSPVIPSSTDAVLVTARVIDDQAGSVTASLFYQEDGVEGEMFIEATMFDDGQHEDGLAGDGVFTATIPPHEHDAIIEFYIVAQDGSGLNRFYPPPSDNMGGQETNLLYQVDDAVRPADLPLYRTIMTQADRDLYQNSNHRCSDAQRNATLIWSYGGRTESRYNVGIRYRGSDSRPLNPPSQRFNIPSDRALLGNTQFNIGGQSPDDQIAGSALWALANEPAADAWAVRVYQNGNNLNPNGYLAQVEVLNNDWAQRHFPLDGNGNGYRGRRANEGPPGGQGAGLQYFGEGQLAYGSYLKQTNRSEQDWSDVVRLTDALNNAPNETYLDDVGQVMNIDQWLRSIAVTEITGYGEFGLLTGDPRGDDWAMYRGVEDPRFVFVPYDMDTMFTGRTGNFLSAAAVPALARLINFPGIFPQLYGHFIDLIDNVFVEDRVRPHLAQLFGGIEPEGAINNMINFLQARGDFIKNSLPLALTVQTTDPILGDFPRTTADTAGEIRGVSNVVHTRSVNVAGEQATWNERTGAWSITGIPLRPGINRLLVEALDESGERFESAWVEIFRDPGSTNDVSGLLSEDATWTVVDGPYRVTGELTVAAGATLTIEPGSSVFLEPGARIVINGRLNAVGTETEQIRFTRTPGTAANWGGLQFRDSMEDNRIHWAVVEWGITNNGMIGLQNSKIELDSVTLDNTDRRRIRTIDSSLVVRNSTFTNIFDPGEAPTTDNESEHIWGSGIPADGEFRLENNFFGHITGHNDGVDFDAPRLPNPIPHIIGNVFAGGGDDALDLTGDVHIEGNTFRNYIKDQFNTDPGESNTISSSGGDFFVLRNVFENIQHASLVKENAFMHFLHNTVVNAQKSALYFDLPGETSGPGRGATVVGSIFENVETAIDLTFPPTGELTVVESLIPESELAAWTNNLSGEALLFDVSAGDFRLRDGSTAQGSGPNGLDMGAEVPAGASIAGEPTAKTRATSATLTVGGPGITHYRYRVNDGPFSDETDVATPIQLTDLTDGSYTVSVIGKDLLGEWQLESEATTSLSWTVDSSLSRLVINEVLASNDTAVDHQGTFPDIIELFNDSPNTISLAGMSMTDDATRPTRFVFPNGTTIGPGEYLTLYADDPNATAGLHLGFNLRREGEGVFFFDSIANGGALIDSVEFGTQVTDLSIGRDRENNWTLTQPTLGSENQAIALGDPSLLKINEWMTISDVVVNNDYLELYNANPGPVSLGGLFLTDNANGWPNRHEIHPLSFIGGDGLALLIADGNPQDGPEHLDFRMSAEMEVIGLADENGKLIDFVRYGPQITDVSEGRTPNGGPEIIRFSLPNPNLDNPGSDDTQQLPLLSIEDEWKFEDSGTDLGNAWLEPAFDDSLWDEGPGLLFVENEPLPAPTNTPLTIGAPTFYFRKRLNLEINPAEIESLNLTTVIDDGAVVHVNGQEALRIGMPNGPITFNTFASRDVDEAQFEWFTIPVSTLVQGENVIAVEVHQTRANSSDIVFGMSMQASVVAPTFSSNNQLLFDHLRITEFNYNPLGGNDFEFIEFQNTGIEPLNLAGVRLSGGVDFTFPDVTIGPGEHIVIVNDVRGFQARYGMLIPIAGQFQGNLSNNSERLRLQLPDPNEINILDFTYDDNWYPVTDGNGFSLVIIDSLGPRSGWAERKSWRPSNFVNGSPGVTDAGFDTEILVINEVLAHTDAPGGDKVELLNTTAGPLNIGGWYLSDSASTLTKYQIPAGTEIPAGEYVVLSEQDNFGAAFTLADQGGQLFLASPDAIGELAGFISTLSYGAVDVEASIGRYAKSDGSVEIVEQAANSLGDDNTGPRVGPIVINEIHYRPLDNADEYIELHNITDTAVSLFDPANPLNTYRLTGAVELEFPTGVEIPADGFALVVGIDPDAFRTKHGIPAEIPILGPYAGMLSDDGADIQLIRPGMPGENFIPQILVEHVEYDDEAPWPVLPAEINASLNRLNPVEFANDVINWEISIVGGTPGAANVSVDVTPPTAPADVTGTVAADSIVELSWTAATDSETDIALYRIFRNGVQIGTSTSNSFIDVEATAPGSFLYAVSAINAQGLEGARSDTSLVQILGVESLSTILPTQILIRFSEPLIEATANNTANYVIDGITIEAAELTAGGRTVKLTTSPLSEGVGYELIISNVESQSIGQLPPGLTIRFAFTEGVPGFTVRGVKSTGQVDKLWQADDLLALPAGDPGIDREQTDIFPTINFLDDDGSTPQGVFGDDSLFPSDSRGDDDGFAIQARGLITIPSGQGGEWTFGANVALPDSGARIAVVPFGSTWQYLDDGSDQGTAWIEPDFDDSGWNSGRAELGYGDGDEATVVDFGGDPTNKFTTTYFRHKFHVSDPSSFIIVLLGSVIRDDGVAIYVNGQEAYRNNLARDAAYNVFADSAISGGAEDNPLSFTVNTTRLVEGENVVAVEIHQADADSADISFDLQINGILTGDEVSDDGLRLRIDGQDVLVADSQNTAKDRLDSVSLAEGVHEIELTFFERSGGAEVELFAAPGAFTSFDETDTWRLVGDVTGGGLAVKTEPPPPTPIKWTRVDPLGSLTFEFAETTTILEGGLAFQTDLLAGQFLSVAADPLGETLIDIEISGDDGVLASTSSASAGQATGISRYVIPTAGTYVVRFESDSEADADLMIALGASLEDEQYLEGPANDTPLTATDLKSGLSEISTGIMRSVVRGVTDGFQQSMFEAGTLFAPNALSFEFDHLPATLGAGQLLIRAQGDLDGGSEFLTIDAEGLFEQDIFVEDGDNSGSSAILTLTAEQINNLAADGQISVTVTPSDGVDDQGGSQIELILQIGDVTHDYYQLSLTGGESIAAVLSPLAGGDLNLDVVDETGTLVVDGIQLSGADQGEVIRNFLAPGDGTYYFRVSGERQRPYQLLVATGAEIDLGFNDSIATAGDITLYGAAIGGLGGARGTIAGGVGATPIGLPINLFDGTGFRWDIQGDGTISDGTSDAYALGLINLDFGFFNSGFAEDNGREIVLGPSPVGESLEVTRKIYVPADEGFARYLEIVTNLGFTDVIYDVNMLTFLGSGNETALVGTSSGDAFFTADDNWIVTDDQDGANDPSLTHVISGNGPVRPSLASSSLDNISYSYELQLAPGETQIIMHFAAQHDTRAEALDKAIALENLELGALAGMSSLELSQLVNFDSADTVDHFALRLSAGDALNIFTETPTTGVAGLVNNLDPIIELLDPERRVVAMDDNSAGDGRNAVLDFDAVVDGEYTVRVTAADGTGEYVLRVEGNAMVAPPLTVVSTEPKEGGRLKTVPAVFRVNFSAPFDATTLDPDDITVNDQPAVGVEVVDGDSVDFLIDPALVGTGGDFTVNILENVFTGLAGGSNKSFQSTFFVDAVAPRLASTLWNGQPLPDDRTVPSGNLLFSATFDEALDPRFLDESDLSIFNTSTLETRPALGIFYDNTSDTFLASFGFVAEGEYRLVIDSRDEAFEDAVGNNLDGEPVGNEADGTPTGDGVEGGDYAITFIVDDPPQSLDTTMTRVEPFGALVHQAEFDETISFTDDFEKYSLAVGAGELLDVSVIPSSSSTAMTLRVVDEANSTIVQELTGESGQPIQLSTLRVAASGRYRVEVSGDRVGTDYVVHVVRNSGFELKDSTPEDPLLLDDTLLDFGAQRWAVIGHADTMEPAPLPTVPDADFYQLDLSDITLGTIDIMLAAIDVEEEPAVELELLGPDGTTVVATGSADLSPDVTAQNVDLAILGFAPAEAGIHTVRVTSDSEIQYHLVVTRDALFEVEPNDELTDPIRSLDDVQGVYGYLSSGGGTSTADDPRGDIFGGTAPAPDIATVSGSAEGGVLSLRIDLHNTIAVDAQWFVYFELDLDQNSATGDPSFQSTFPPGQQGGPLGVERRVLLGTPAVTGGIAIIFDNSFNQVGQAPLTVGDNFFAVEVPLSVLNDDGNVNFGSIAGVGGQVFTGDAAPDTMFLSVVVGGGGGGDEPGDLYQITLAAGQALKLSTQTPLDGPGDSLVNKLDPAIELLDPMGAIVAEDANSAADGKNADLNFTATEAGIYTVRVFPEENGGEYLLLLVAPDDETQVVGRSFFYNNSAFDGDDPTANSSDDAAIAVDKTALLPGQTATFANYTSYARGINGIMIDIDRLAGTPTVEDFEFRVGNDDQPENWPTAPAPSSVTVRPSAGENGSSRIVLIWDDNAIEKQWLQVTVRATEQTGLMQPDTFYFGNAIGDSGDSVTDAKVNASDEIAARNNTRTFVDPAPIDDAFDYNRDERVNATDEIISRNNATTFVNELRLITPPVVATAADGDFNGDGHLDIADIDMLTIATAAGDNDPAFDLDGDGLVSYGDIFTWVVDLFGSNPGDADLSGVVDGEDRAIWNAHRYTASSLWSEADFNGDGWVDGRDFDLWNEHRFTNPGEPANMLAALNAIEREPRAAVSVDATDELPLPWRPSVRAEAEGQLKAVKHRQLVSELHSWSHINNLIWTSWPARGGSAGEGTLEQSDLNKWTSHGIRRSARQGAASKWLDDGVEMNVANEELTALDAFFALRMRDW